MIINEERIHWITYKQVTTSQGTFKMTWDHAQHWEPSEYVFIDDAGIILWQINKPFGNLYKYPCGTKQFIKIEEGMEKSKQFVSVVIGEEGEEIIDPDIKAIYLISEAMRISTPRMRKQNLRFVLSRPKYKIQVK